MDGVLVIRKEKGYTSHDVVAKLRGILHMKKIGHTGTQFILIILIFTGSVRI